MIRVSQQDPAAAEHAAGLLADAVPLDPAWAWIWRAWQRLNLDRPMLGGGFGGAVPGRIPFRDIVTWCAAHDYGDDQRQFLDHCLTEMDAEFLAQPKAEQ